VGQLLFITTAISADLGTHGSNRRNPHALATTTAIIDGTRPIGAIFGPYLTALILPTEGWNVVFAMLATCVITTLHVLTH
jgi:OPA family glycerol-3-phosphate transporter-like MFS transporter 1/2